MRDAARLEISVDSPIRGSFECRSTLECLGAPLLRITRWERSVKTDEGVVKILRCFAGSKVVPPEAPFETDERRRIEKRYGDNVTSYGDWESLRIIRNELNSNRMMAWLFWLKEESARDPSIVQSARNPFRTELLPDSNPIFGVLRPAAHLPALDQIVGFASVFQTIAGLQILRRAPQMPGQGDEVQALMPSVGLPPISSRPSRTSRRIRPSEIAPLTIQI